MEKLRQKRPRLALSRRNMTGCGCACWSAMDGNASAAVSSPTCKSIISSIAAVWDRTHSII